MTTKPQSPNSSPPTFVTSLFTPAHATAVAFNDDEDVLAVGSDDGSVRLYKPPESKVIKAIRGLGDTVSGIVFGPRTADAIHVAAGHMISHFSITSSAMISRLDDAISRVDVRERPTDDDSLNNIAVDVERTRIAFTLDSGGIGVLDTGTGQIKRMKPKHSSIAYVVAFIPGRPNEIVSGGYDCALLHYNVKEGTLLSRFDFPATTPLAPGISRSPPFITSLALSSNGVIAAGSADGRVWISRSGERVDGDYGSGKNATAIGKADKKKKKNKNGTNTQESKKWLGLLGVKGERCKGDIIKFTDELVPTLHIITSTSLIVSSLSGELSCLDLSRSGESSPRSLADISSSTSDGKPSATLWTSKLRLCAKVNAMARAPRSGWTAVAGLDSTLTKGVVEIWKDDTVPVDGAKREPTAEV